MTHTPSPRGPRVGATLLLLLAPTLASALPLQPILAQEAGDRVRIPTTHANVHMAPGSGSQVLILPPQGTELPVVGRRGEWIQVQLAPELRRAEGAILMRWYRGEDRGWMHESTVELVGRAPGPRQRPWRPMADGTSTRISGEVNRPRRQTEGERPTRMGGYEIVADWPRWPDDAEHEGWTWGSASGAWAESPDKVWLAQRGEIELPAGVPAGTRAGLLEPPHLNTGRWAYADDYPGFDLRRHHILVAVNRDGEIIEEWLDHDAYLAPPREHDGLGSVSRGPHKVLMNPYDPERHIWIVDDDMHEINVFTNDGDLVHTMGVRGVPGRGPNNFNRPTDIAWLPDGTFFVSDGYAGTRVAKFDADFNFIMDWGRPPVDPDNPGPYEFFSVHSIGISNDRRIFVADREHHRMQVFDENGNFLDMWPTGHNSAVLAHIVTEDDYVWVADMYTDRLVKYDLEGRYILDIGGPGAQPGQFNAPHQLWVDEERNLYVSEVIGDRIQKFRPLPNADPATIISPMVGARTLW